MQTYTKNEQRIFNIIAADSMEGGAMDITDFKNDELSTKQIRGVISSLVKKGKIWVDDDECHRSPVFWPRHSVYNCCFWTDCVPEGEEEFITDDEVVEEKQPSEIRLLDSRTGSNFSVPASYVITK